MDIFGGKSEDFGSPINKIYSLFGGNSEDFGCPVDRHGTRLQSAAVTFVHITTVTLICATY